MDGGFYVLSLPVHIQTSRFCFSDPLKKSSMKQKVCGILTGYEMFEILEQEAVDRMYFVFLLIQPEARTECRTILKNFGIFRIKSKKITFYFSY